MKLNQLQVSPIKEGLNLLKVFPGHALGKTWSRPVSINFLITSRCNSKCITCDSWKLTNHDGELTVEDFARIAKEARAMGIPIVTIGGGEPTLRKDIWDIVKAFKDHGLNVQLTTNALALRDGQREKMYASGLDRVTVSVDSHLPATYEKIRGVDGADNVLQNIRDILTSKPDHLFLDTNTVFCRDNAETFLDTLDFLMAMGVPKVNFSAITTSGENYLMTETKEGLADIPMPLVEKIVEGLLARKKSTTSISASKAFIEGIIDYYVDPTKLVYPCYAGYLTLDIFQDGAVHGCGNLPSYANIKNHSLQEVWTGLTAQKNREDMANGKCPNCYLSCKIELAVAANPKHTLSFGIDRVLSSL